jgi:co-chaperonin GroES (HSP10)
MSDQPYIIEPEKPWGPGNIRPKKDWAVVCLDKRKTTLSWGLHIPMVTNHEKLHEGSATVLRFGRGPIAIAEKLAIGDRVLFRGYLKDISKLPNAGVWEDGEPKECFMLSLKDVTAVIAKGAEVGLLSERKG